MSNKGKMSWLTSEVSASVVQEDNVKEVRVKKEESIPNNRFFRSLYKVYKNLSSPVNDKEKHDRS